MEATTQKIQVDAIINRIKLVVLSPKECWETVAQEDDSPQTVLSKIILPLLVLGTVCSLVGNLIFVRGTDVQPSAVSMLAISIILCVLQVGLLYVGSWLIQKLSPVFQGAASPQKAFSLLAHSELPIFAGGLLGIYPPLGLLAFPLFAVAIYAFYQGVPKMTTVPENSRLTFTASFIVTMMLATLVIYVAVLPIVFWLVVGSLS